MTVRFASAKDADAVLALIRTTPGLPQWGREALATAEPDPSSEKGPIRRLLVAEDEGKLAGFAQVVTLLGEAELESIAVEPTSRRQGVGDLLLQRAMETVRADGATLFRLEVRRSNEAALRLYRLAGLLEVGVRRGYYTDPVEDALLLRCSWTDGG